MTPGSQDCDVRVAGAATSTELCRYGTSRTTAPDAHYPRYETSRTSARTILALLTLLLAAHTPATPRNSLLARTDDDPSWIIIHDPSRAVYRFPETPRLEPSWRHVNRGIETATLHLSYGAHGLPMSVALARIDPRYVSFSLEKHTRAGGSLGDWSIASLADDAIFGVNAGQFAGGLPWGWWVKEGVELAPPGHGPLSTAVVFDTAGHVRLVPWRDIPRHRFGRGLVYAFQSYPTLLDGDGRVPDALRSAGRGVDLDHHDVRLALGSQADGRLIIALTRFADAAGVSMPWGPTVSEMAALLGSLGARHAVLLDGGLSAQLVVRDTTGAPRAWSAPRRVPLALVGTPR